MHETRLKYVKDFEKNYEKPPKQTQVFIHTSIPLPSPEPTAPTAPPKTLFEFLTVKGRTRLRHFPTEIPIPLCSLRGKTKLFDVETKEEVDEYLEACIDTKAEIGAINISQFKVLELKDEMMLVEKVIVNRSGDKYQKYLVSAQEIASIWTYRWDEQEYISPNLNPNDCSVSYRDSAYFLNCEEKEYFEGNDLCQAVYNLSPVDKYLSTKTYAQFKINYLKLPAFESVPLFKIHQYHEFVYSMGCGT